MSVSEFRGSHYFLSNFYSCQVLYQGLTYPSSENAFQAAKSTDPDVRARFLTLSPNEAKGLGRRIKMREDWDTIKLNVMWDVLVAKFNGNPLLKEKLMATGTTILQEGNTWHDTYWGIDLQTGKGENHLGRLLMELREEYLYTS